MHQENICGVLDISSGSLGILNVSRMVTQGLGYSGSTGFRCDGDAGKNDCQSGICRIPGVYSNLLRGSGGMDRSMLLHSTDLPALRQKGDGDTGR